jgi:diguanylate cyclase (GGDEF)-like protein/PAS domain S-box-containing protein
MPPAVRRRLQAAQRALPRGNGLPLDAWRRRHRSIVVLLWVHVAIVAVWGVVAGGPTHGVAEVAPVLTGALVAGWSRLSRGARMIAATTGLYAASAVLIHLSGGVIEAHFHIFFVLGLVMLYEDWRPLVADAVFVLVHHGVLGTLAPESMYNHPAALAHPVRWAAVHAGFVSLVGITAVLRWRALERERRRTEHILDATGEGVYGLDLDGVITFANPSCSRLLGWSADDLLGRHHHDVLRHTMPGAPGFDRDECPTCAVVDAGTGDTVRDHQLTRRDMTTFAVELRALPLSADGDAGGTVVSFRDVSRQVELVHQASHDALTGLPNRHLLDDRLDQAIARGRRSGRLAGCIFVDLDQFKSVNDELGHAVGDRILVETAARCRRAVRPGDTVARYGGDEFVVVCDGLVGPGDAVAVARRLLEQFAEPFDVGGHDLRLVPSVGVATAASGTGGAALLRQADAAMYAAKRAGGGLRVAGENAVVDLDRMGASGPLDLRRSGGPGRDAVPADSGRRP